MRRTRAHRPLGEALEARQLLTFVGLEASDIERPESAMTSQADSGIREPAAAQSETMTIQELMVSVNGVLVTLDPLDRLDLLPGDLLQVESIAFSSTSTEGTFAAEGYISKIADANSRSAIDYLDARISSPDSNQEATGGDGVVRGLSDAWEVEAGWDRLTLVLMHYTADSIEVAGRILIRLQVGQPEFLFDASVLNEVVAQPLSVGKAVEIPGRWMNVGAGLHHNYAEVDIFGASNPNQVVWAGALVGNAGTEQAVEGTFVNLREHDGFSELWIPEHQGEYVFKYYLDPENFALESDETNNEHQITVTVPRPEIVAPDLTFDATDTMQVVSEAAVIYENETVYFEDFEDPDSFTGEFDPDGTDSATDGRWVVVTPTISSEWNGISLQLEAANGQGSLVTGGQPSFDERFVEANWLQVTGVEESQFAWGFQFENTTWRRIETWAAHVKNANYALDASQLTNQEAFTYTSVDHGDGTYDHLFVGSEPVMPYTAVGEIRLPNANFDDPVGSDGLVLGVLSPTSPGESDLDGGVSSVRTERISLPAAEMATLSLNYNLAYLANASTEDFLRLTILGADGARKVLFEELADDTHHPAQWQAAEFDITEFAGQGIQLLIEAADGGSPSLFEAGIDDIAVTTMGIRHLRVASFTQPEHGTVTLDDDNLTFHYLAEAGYSGEDYFTYVLTDGEHFSNRGTITVLV